MLLYHIITPLGDNLAPLDSLYSLSTLNLTNVRGPGATGARGPGGPGAQGPGGLNKGHGARPKIYLLPKYANFGRATCAFYYFPQFAASPRLACI